VSLAIFDDHVEVWSAGGFPKGITPEALTQNHQSVQRNPMIADVFHRTGLIEKWGRGTNRVVAMCREAGIAPPEFEEITGAAVVTFRVHVGQTARPEVESKVESQPDSRPESLDRRVLTLLKPQAMGKSEISAHLGQKAVSGQLNKVIRELIDQGLIEYTLPDKPNSRLQKYRLTGMGKRAAEGRSR
jgi:ATP-dependent DNA helicase RecG